MPNARPTIAVAAAVAALTLAACHKQQPAQPQDQKMAMDDGVPTNEVLANSDIETLPADESSTTPSNQLENGFDNPDVNDLGPSNSE